MLHIQHGVVPDGAWCRLCKLQQALLHVFWLESLTFWQVRFQPLGVANGLASHSVAVVIAAHMAQPHQTPDGSVSEEGTRTST